MIMKKVLPFLTAAIFTLTAGAADKPLTPAIRNAVLFQDGVAAIHSEVNPGKSTLFRIGGAIAPIDGTLWFSDVCSTVKRIIIEKDKPVYGTADDITTFFQNSKVTVTLQTDAGLNIITGTLFFPPVKGEQSGTAPLKYVYLRQGNGSITIIPVAKLVRLTSTAAPAAAPIRIDKEKLMLWEVALKSPINTPFGIQYLSSGLSWQAAGRIILNPGTMKMLISCDIVNNLADLNNTGITLASGKINLANAGKISPMALLKLHRPVPLRHMAVAAYGAKNAVYEDTAVAERAYSPAPPRMTTGETQDIQILSIGAVSLKKGEVMHTVIGEFECNYERLVTWQVNDANPHPRNYRQSVSHTRPFDAIRFINPQKSSLPAMPVEILDGNVVIGQTAIKWINGGEKALLTITPAQTVKTQAVHYEVPAPAVKLDTTLFHQIDRNASGTIVGGRIAGSRYRFCHLQHELKVKNYRTVPVKMLISAECAGNVSNITDNGKITPLDKLFSINARQKIDWELQLAPGEEKVIKYRSTRLLQY